MHLRRALMVTLLLSLLSLAHNHPLLLPSTRQLGLDDSFYCQSWRFNIEVNNTGVGSTTPMRCVDYVKQYMEDGAYEWDSATATLYYSLEFALSVRIANDGKDAWVFDVDEVLLSNLPYYQKHGFGSQEFNEDCYNAWVSEAKAPALSGSLRFYEVIQQLGFKILIFTGRDEPYRKATEENLKSEGFDNWERLMLRGPEDQGKKAVVYKSERRQALIDEGYRIRGNSGAQWSDLMGYAVAERSFKLPNPMYYIA